MTHEGLCCEHIDVFNSTVVRADDVAYHSNY